MSESQNDVPPEDVTEESFDDDGFVLVRRRGAIGEVVFNRPDRLNALTQGIGDGIERAFRHLSERDEIKVVIFRGIGRAFSTGGDVSWIGSQYSTEEPPIPGEKKKRTAQRTMLGRDERGFRVWESILHCNKVVVAEGKGYVLGVSLDWFLAADIAICSSGTILGYPPTRMIGASGTSTAFNLLRMGPALHAEICLMGRHIDAEEAQRRNLINWVVPPDNLEAAVEAACQAISYIPIDGLFIGKFNRKVAYDLLGARTSQMQSAMGHAMQVQQRMESGEWNIVREREQFGVKGAFRRRDERFEEAFATLASLSQKKSEQ